MPMLIPTPDDATEDDSIRAKWMLDGATTLEEAALLTEEAAKALRALAAAGWELAEPVEDDYGFLRRT
jgi:hypothetical protein